MELSVVIPVHNEQDNIALLLQECDEALSGKLDFEVLVVDDGSDDATRDVLRTAKTRHPFLRVVSHQARYGQSAAIHSGVSAAFSPWIATLDGDGQNDPTDIVELYQHLLASWPSKHLIAVVGHRRKRHDHWWRRVCSRIANTIRGGILGDRIPDTGCGLKVFSREAFLCLPYFNHMHRFLPALLLREGGHVESVEVEHRPRTGGTSHYGVGNRLWVGMVDLFGVWWLIRRNTRAKIINEDD